MGAREGWKNAKNVNFFLFSFRQILKSPFTLLYALKKCTKNSLKELGLCHKFWFVTLQTINLVTSNNLSLKYERLTPLGCINIGIRKFEIVAKT